MLTNQTQPAPVMFCHDSTNIYYPTAPGRVYIIAITALADCDDCDGSDEGYSNYTSRGDLSDLMAAGNAHGCHLSSVDVLPETWPGEDLYTIGEIIADWRDALEQWADWCDRDSVRLDSLDEIKGAIGRAA